MIRQASFGSLLFAALLAASASAADQAPEHFLERIYHRYVGAQSKGAPLDTPADVKRLFAPELATLILDDRANAAGEVPRLDYDPFVGGQDWQIAKVDVSAQRQGDAAAVGTVKFTDNGEARTVVLDLVKLKAGWRIREITIDGKTLSAALTAG